MTQMYLDSRGGKTENTGYKRVLLIVPPFYRLLGGKNNWIHLGQSYVAATLDRHGHFVRIYNMDHRDDMSVDIALRELFEGQVTHDEAIANPEHTIWKEAEETIRSFRPDLIGITIVFSVIMRSVDRIAAVAKKVNPDIKVAVGGPHATLVKDTVRKPNFDFLVRGEGEYPFLELVEGRPLDAIQGLSYKLENGEVVHNPDRAFVADLDEFPNPKLELQLIEIKDPENNFGTMAFSRGCNLKCIFCSSPELWGNKIRYRSLGNVIAELEERYHNYGVKRYYFADDNMNLNRKYAKQLCREIINRGLKIHWICEARVNTFDEELLDLMREAGCRRIKLGIESGSDRMLQYMKKAIKVKHIYETTRLIRNAGIQFTAYVMIGLPAETREEMMMTYEMCKEIDPDYISVSIATPHIGTELYTISQDMGISFPEDMWSGYYAQSNRCILNPNVDKDIIDMFLDLNEKKGAKRTIAV